LCRRSVRTLRPLKVGLNLLHLVPGSTGGSEIYARRLIPALLETRGDLEVVAFASREGAPSLRGEPWTRSVSVIELPVRATSRARRVLAEQTLLPLAVRRAGADILHNLFSTAPALRGVPQVTTIHDLIYKRFPEAHAGPLSIGMSALVPLAARRSSRIIAVSSATRNDVIEFLHADPAKVEVIYEGPGSRLTADPEPEDTIRGRHSLGDAPIILSVSAHRPHKNIERLIDAMARIERPAVLVVPGYETPWDEELRAHALQAGASERVRFLGWVSDDELEGLYQAAICLAFPSLAEGFGLPVLEAMIRGLPVACSDAASLPEVAGEAALYFDPLDTGEMAEAIAALLRDADLRERLAAAGRERATGFTWSRAAAETVACYERALAA
jgi:glycosyltransferase involved in cell wall biosynthesis